MRERERERKREREGEGEGDVFFFTFVCLMRKDKLPKTDNWLMTISWWSSYCTIFSCYFIKLKLFCEKIELDSDEKHSFNLKKDTLERYWFNVLFVFVLIVSLKQLSDEII